MKFKITIALIACALLLTGCSSEPETKAWGISKAKAALAQAEKDRRIILYATDLEGSEEYKDYYEWLSFHKPIDLKFYIDDPRNWRERRWLYRMVRKAEAALT